MLERIIHNVDDLFSLMQKCRTNKKPVQAKELLAFLHKQQLDTHSKFGNLLVPMLVDCGCLSDAHNVFDMLPDRKEYSWTSLISGYSDCGEPQSALFLYHEMQQAFVQPKCYTYVAVLKACTRLIDVVLGQVLHSEIVMRGLELNCFVGNILIDFYGKCGLVSEAQHVLEKHPDCDAVSWTALISAYAEHGLGECAVSGILQMQSIGVSPVSATFVCCLKACGIEGCVEKVQVIHVEIMKRAFEKDAYVGSTLVDVYSKCGMLDEAQHVFDHADIQNAVLWNALIAGHVEHGCYEEALEMVEEMKQGDLLTTDVTFIWSLKACGCTADKHRGYTICMEITKMAFDNDAFVVSTMADMYVKCGLLMEARHILDHIAIQNIVTWNALLGGYVEHGLAKEALICFKELQLEGIPPDMVTYCCGLKACGITRSLGIGTELHVGFVKSGFQKELILGNTLVDMYAKCGSLDAAQKAFDMLVIRDGVSWAALISGYAEYEFDNEVLHCYDQMQRNGILGDDITLVRCLKACGTLGCLETGHELHAMVKKSGQETDLFLGNTLLDMYGKCGSVSEAQKVFAKMPIRDVVTWNAMLKCYGENHEGYSVVQCFKNMQRQGVEPDAITFTCLLAACSHANMLLEGHNFFTDMVEEHGMKPTLDHYTCMIDLLGRSGCVLDAERYAEVIQCLPSKEIPKALLTACKVYGEADMGVKCFNQLFEANCEDASPYMLMASIYAGAGRLNDANVIEEVRKHVGAKKKLASACIEVDKTLHEFLVGACQHKNIYTTLESLTIHMKNGGYVPSLELILC